MLAFDNHLKPCALIPFCEYCSLPIRSYQHIAEAVLGEGGGSPRPPVSKTSTFLEKLSHKLFGF